MMAQPTLYFAFAMVFRVIEPYASEGFLLTLLPTLALTTIALLVTVAVGIDFAGAK